MSLELEVAKELYRHEVANGLALRAERDALRAELITTNETIQSQNDSQAQMFKDLLDVRAELAQVRKAAADNSDMHAAEMAWVGGDYERMKAEVIALRAEVARLRGELEFYADERNYGNSGAPGERKWHFDYGNETQYWDADMGRKARAALQSPEEVRIDDPSN